MEELPEDVRRLLVDQGGVCSRAQLATLGRSPVDVRRWRRHRLLVAIHPGVYVAHTGAPTWHERAWAAVLVLEPAALHGCCALRAAHGPGWRGHDDTGPVHVSVATHRRISPPTGVAAHRVTDLDARTQWHRSPPRERLEDAVVDAAAGADDDWSAVQVVTAGVGARTTTAARLLETLEDRPRIARRAFLTGLLRDVAEGACSVLEVVYLRDVERAHRLPRGVRQAPRADRPGLRDVLYPNQDVVVELDGRIDHTHVADREADLDRDLAALGEGLTTARVGWGQAAHRACRTARSIGTLLQRHGWEDEVVPCRWCA